LPYMWLSQHQQRALNSERYHIQLISHPSFLWNPKGRMESLTS
jgi:hypothetical protein